MKKILILYLFVAGILSAQKITWVSAFEGFNLSEELDKPVLVYFKTDWCGYCRQMDMEVFSDEGTAALIDSNFITVKINPEKDKSPFTVGENLFTPVQFAEAAGATSFPYFAFLNSKGQIIGYLRGYYPKEDFEKVVKKVRELAKDE